GYIVSGDGGQQASGFSFFKLIFLGLDQFFQYVNILSVELFHPSSLCNQKYLLSLQHFLIAADSISPSERFPEDFKRSTSMRSRSMVSLFILFFSANFMAMPFSSIFEEYRLGIFPSTKLNMC